MHSIRVHKFERSKLSLSMSEIQAKYNVSNSEGRKQKNKLLVSHKSSVKQLQSKNTNHGLPSFNDFLRKTKVWN